MSISIQASDLIEVEQGSPEWLELRRSKIGSSDVAAIMGVSPYGTAYTTWLNKTGRAQEKEVNLAMMRGTDAEPKIRALYESLTDMDCPPAVIVGQGVPWAMVSLDGYNEEASLVLEIKYPGRESHEIAKQGKVPDHYYPQVQYQLLVTGAKRAHYVSYQEDKETGTNEIEIVAVTPDREYWAKMIPALEAFWQCVVTDTPPPLSDRDFMEITEPSVVPLFETWRDAKLVLLQLDALLDESHDDEATKQLKARVKEERAKLEAAREKIAASLPHPKVRCGGVKVITKKTGSLDIRLDESSQTS